MPVFDFSSTPDAKNPSICTYTTFQSNESNPSPENPILLIDNKQQKWEQTPPFFYHRCSSVNSEISPSLKPAAAR